MKLEMTRRQDGRYETLITRDDGVRYHLNGVAHTHELPHDLAHYVVEGGLGLRDGFWGGVADGAVVGSMTHVDGRRKPRATERSKAILKANAETLGMAETLIGLFKDAVDEGRPDPGPVIRRRLGAYRKATGRKADPWTDADIDEVLARWQAMLTLWRELPEGEALTLEWPTRPPPERRKR